YNDEEVKKIVATMEALENTDYCCNPLAATNRELAYNDINAILRAAKYGNLAFTETALKKWLAKIGGKIFLRGHEIEIGHGPLSEKIFYTLQSTGKNGKEDNESGFKNIET